MAKINPLICLGCPAFSHITGDVGVQCRRVYEEYEANPVYPKPSPRTSGIGEMNPGLVREGSNGIREWPTI